MSVVDNSCVGVSLMLKCCENQIFMEKTCITSHRVDRSCLSWNHGPTDTGPGPAQCQALGVQLYSAAYMYSCTVQCSVVSTLKLDLKNLILFYSVFDVILVVLDHSRKFKIKIY